jgi:predicted transcriptional regulator
MKEITKAEEQVMQNLWKLGKGFVKDVIELFDDPKPAYNTVSTIIRILEKKEFVSYKAYGNTYEYFPIVSKEEYTKKTMKKFVGNYFGNSYQNMFSYFSKNENMTIKELEEIKAIIEKEINSKKK